MEIIPITNTFEIINKYNDKRIKLKKVSKLYVKNNKVLFYNVDDKNNIFQIQKRKAIK